MRALILVLVSLVTSASLAMKVDLKQSEFTWKGEKVTGTHAGKIFLKSAELKTTGDKVTSGSFVMDMNSFTVGDLSGKYQKKFLKHVKSDDFFDVKKYPTAKLVIDKIDAQKAFGKLTIKGQTHPVIIKFKQQKGTYTGKFGFDRTKFNMRYGSGKFFKKLGDKMIKDEVLLTFKVVAAKAK